MRRLINIHNEMHDERPEGESLASLFSSLLYQQWPYATSLKQEFTRSYLLMADSVEGQVPRPPGAWADVLGGELDEVIKATFVLMVGASINAGTFNPAWLEQENFRSVNELVDSRLVLSTAKRLTTTIGAAREDAANVTAKAPLPQHLEQYGYNPLSRTPFVDLGHAVVYAPQYQLIMHTASPGSLYYAAIARWGNAFVNHLGRQVEAYVGRQLRHSGELDLRDEIVWGASQQRSVDWFLVLPSLLVLIECKSARLPLTARSGDEQSLREYVERSVGQARRQINRGVAGIRALQPQYNSLPADREMLGLVVTAEPIYVANAREVDRHLPAAEVPTVAISLRDVEKIAVLTPIELEAALRAVAFDENRRGNIFHTEFARVLSEDSLRRPNPLIDQAYRRHLAPITDEVDFATGQR